jgi:prephenate dehydrogenase
LQEALTLGVIDETAILENVDADFVIVSVPVDVALTVLPARFDW